MKKASIIIPVIRPDNIPAMLDCIKKNAGIPEDEYEVLTLEDTERVGFSEMISRLVAMSQSENVMFLGDDTMPRADFLINALWYMAQLPDHFGVIKLNDFDGQSHVPAHWMCHKKMLPLLDGEFAHKGYTHSFCDNELGDRAQELGRYVFGEKAQIDHNHPCHGKGEMDDDYERVYNDENFRHDQQLFLKRKTERGRVVLAVCIPTVSEKDYNAFWFSFTKIRKPQNWKLLTPAIKCGDGHGIRNIAQVRNDLVLQALHWRINATHIIMCDSDQVYRDPDTFYKFINHNKPFVGARIHRRYPPFEPLLMRGNPGEYMKVNDEMAYGGDLIPIDATGGGCFCIQSHALLDLKPPFFEFGEREPEEEGKPAKPVGEDILFCEKLKEAGHDLFVDTSIGVDHLSTVGINRDYHEIFKYIIEAQYAGMKGEERDGKN